MACVLLLPREATNEGSRRIRELLRRHTCGSLARRMRCDEGSIRYWATERGKPGRILRGRGAEVFGIAESAWDEAPSRDAYSRGNDVDPETRKR